MGSSLSRIEAMALQEGACVWCGCEAHGTEPCKGVWCYLDDPTTPHGCKCNGAGFPPRPFDPTGAPFTSAPAPCERCCTYQLNRDHDCQEAIYVRTIKGLTGEERLISAELQGEGDLRRLRLVFDRAVVEPTYVAYEIPREY